MDLNLSLWNGIRYFLFKVVGMWARWLAFMILIQILLGLWVQEHGMIRFFMMNQVWTIYEYHRFLVVKNNNVTYNSIFTAAHSCLVCHAQCGGRWLGTVHCSGGDTDGICRVDRFHEGKPAGLSPVLGSDMSKLVCMDPIFSDASKSTFSSHLLSMHSSQPAIKHSCCCFCWPLVSSYKHWRLGFYCGLACTCCAVCCQDIFSRTTAWAWIMQQWGGRRRITVSR